MGRVPPRSLTNQSSWEDMEAMRLGRPRVARLFVGKGWVGGWVGRWRSTRSTHQSPSRTLQCRLLYALYCCLYWQVLMVAQWRCCSWADCCHPQQMVLVLFCCSLCPSLLRTTSLVSTMMLFVVHCLAIWCRDGFGAGIVYTMCSTNALCTL